MKLHPRRVLLPAALAVFQLLTPDGLTASPGLIPDLGETLVFERTYSADHLGKHPEQTVKAMRLRLKRSTDGQRVLARISVWQRDQSDVEFSADGFAMLPAGSGCLPVVLDPVSSCGRVSVELRKDGAARVRILDFAGFLPARAPGSPPDVAARTGSLTLTAEDRENALFKLNPTGGGKPKRGGVTSTTWKPAAEGGAGLRIRAGAVGPIALGTKIGELRLPAGLVLRKTIQTVKTEEGDSQETRHELRDGDAVLLSIEPRYDPVGNRDTGFAGEIMALSPTCRTAEGVGPGSTLKQLAAAYSRSRLWYTYVSDRFVFETPDLEGVQFLLDARGYKGTRDKLTASDLVTLPTSSFAPETKVTAVRILEGS